MEYSKKNVSSITPTVILPVLIGFLGQKNQNLEDKESSPMPEALSKDRVSKIGKPSISISTYITEHVLSCVFVSNRYAFLNRCKDRDGM